jgi:hypothetical protein
MSVAGPKLWQHGYDMNFLYEIEQRFAAFNEYARGPFAEMNKPQIAQRLNDGSMAIFPWGIVDSVFPRYPGPIYSYQDVAIAQKLAGDQIINAFCYNDDQRNTLIDHLAGRPGSTFMWVWQESSDERAIAEKAGFEFVACKFSSMGEIRGLWFKDADNAFFPRTHPQLDAAERTGIAKLNIPVATADLLEAVVEIAHIARDYTPHYSNYSVKKTWSALSLRGYTDDPGFITKPAEMNAKWHKQHEGQEFRLQNTPLRGALKAVDRLHAPLTALGAAHRIRLMKLEPQGGELRRHTDQVDKDSGIGDGKVARFHIPLITNDDCVFGSWDLDGQRHDVRMRVGECWYLDTRKPHTATNNGTLPRIHLVVDIESNADVRALLSC